MILPLFKFVKILISLNKSGDIILIEDDADDREIFSSIYSQLNYQNKLVVFEDGVAALDYLKNPEVYPFMIISDINMPRMGGFELREYIFSDDSLSSKCIPYIFLTTAHDERSVEKAYKLSIQGYFQKDPSFKAFKEKFKQIMEYWQNSLIPSRAL